jgi:hypothetical protein
VSRHEVVESGSMEASASLTLFGDHGLAQRVEVI